MDDHERHRQRIRVRQAALRKLGAVNIYCFCGEDDPLCFEADHIYRRDLDGTCYGICKNHHAKRSARGWSEHPPVRGDDRSPAQKNTHLLLGVADYLEFIAPLLREAAEVSRDRPRDASTE